MPHIAVNIAKATISSFCMKHHITKLAFFGSVLGDNFRPDSDIDVLVEFEAGHVPGLRFIDIELELSTLLGGRKIDLVTPKFLNKRIRDGILSSAVVQYAQG